MNSLLTRLHTPGRLLAALALALPVSLLALAAPASAQVVISQVYGGGGNSGATLRNDFIELLNTGSAPVAVGGWSVQYTSATGSNWQVTAIPAGTTMQPGRYLLVQQAAGAGGSVSLPTPDVVGNIAMGGSAGKVALSNASSALSGSTPGGAAVVDVVSYGSNATPVEGSPTPNLSNSTAALRNGEGCTDTNDNSADFSVGAPNPRNSSAPAASCEGGGGPGPVDPLAASIPAIQGIGSTSPLVNQVVVTSGVVTRINSNGFFIQALEGDDDPATSDGLFVFTGDSPFPAAQVGSLVQVTGTVREFSAGAGMTANPLTQLAQVSSVSLLGTGYSLQPVLVTLPVAEGQTLEPFEGMLVTLAGPLTVQQNFFQARFGQITIGAGGRHENPTNRFRPGSQANALFDLWNRSRVLLDDGSALQNPNPTPYFGANGLPRGGDTFSSVTGVLDYGPATASTAGFALYRIHPTAPVSVSATNPRRATPPAVPGNLRIAALNVLNYFTTFTNGQNAQGQTGQGCTLGGSTSAGNCRGANNLEEFLRQRSKIVAALAALDADAVGLMEIQNHGSVAAQNLVDALNAAVGAGTYAVLPDPAAGTGTDAIKLALIYKPARLAPVGGGFSDTAPINNRPTLAQVFTAPNGEKLILAVNHLKSKGGCPGASSPDADQGDGQACWNARRLAQAQQLRSFIGQVQAATGVTDALLLGDMNSYGQEDPIFELTSNGYVDEFARFNSLAYGYVFDGFAGRLDHAIGTASLSPRVGGTVGWHINADEQVAHDYNLEFKQPACATCAPDPFDGSTPFRSSDHDPILVGLHWYKTLNGTPGRDVLVGTPGDDIFIGRDGGDRITTGAGQDIIVMLSVRDAGDIVTDFTPGQDRVDLRTLLASIGYSGSNALADGVVQIRATRGGLSIDLDLDGSSSNGARPRSMVLLNGVSPAQFDPARDLILPQAATRALKPAAARKR